MTTGCAQPNSEPTQTRKPADEYGGGLAGERIESGDWDRAIAKARQDTAIVHNTGCDFDATGSAVAIDADRMVTNRHVVAGARSLSIESTTGKKARVTSWTVSRTDDLALLKISKPIFPKPVEVSSREIVPGDLLVVMGYPLGGPFTVGRGRVTDLRGHGASTMIEASVDILPGNSGGPLVDTHGDLVGLVRAIDLESGSALAIPRERVAALLEDGGTVGSPCTPH